MDKNINKEDLWCEYSDLPSPKAYASCTDYDSMGNYGRFPKPKTQETTSMKRIIQKIVLWMTFRFPKNKRKDIWDL